MKIQTFKKGEYKGCPIYVRRMETTFEYITVIKNEVYTFSVDLKPKFKNDVLCFLGLGQRYLENELKAMITYLTKAAEATIDTVTNGTKENKG
jgi:hypothetical protein